MRIKRVDIIGFKSFVDKVSLDFQQRITGVVGPNGCGKSNIVDAIRWAMGEQNARNLRGRAMEDIIFGGSESRKPHGMAEVSIIFDNSEKLCPEAYRDYTEIMVTRRLYRNGDSEYLINKTQCRLLDITELFMDTGVGSRSYSIIEQGKIGQLVSARPEERRALIEEAAGVTKFKARKKSAQRKMDATRQNLVRLGDIISEVRRQTGSLKRQAQQAGKFRELRGEAKRIEICMAGNRFRVLRDELVTLEESLGGRSEALGSVEARLAEGDLQLESRRLQLLEVEEELSLKQEQDYALGGEIQRVEGVILLSDQQREDLQRQTQNMEIEQEQIASRMSQLEVEAAELEQSETRLGTELEDTEEAVALQQESLLQKQATEEELVTRLDAARRQQIDMLSEAGRLGNRQEEITRRLASEDERQQRNRREVDGLQAELKTCEAQLAELQAATGVLSSGLEEQQGQRELLAETILQLKGEQLSAEGELLEKRQVLEKQRSRLESLEELEQNLDGYSDGVQVLFRGQPAMSQQVVADLMTSAPEYETVIEIALGERLQAVPVADKGQVEELLGILADRGARAALACPVELSGSPQFSAGQPLIELVTPVVGREKLVAVLLSGCYLVDSVLTYLSTTLPHGTMLVDYDGRSLGWRGDLAGGATAMAGAGLLRKKREIGELEKQVVDLDRQLVDQQQRVRQLQQNREAQEDALQELDRLLQQQALKHLELQKDFDRLSHEQSRLKERLDLLGFEEAQLREERQQLLAEQAQIAQRRQELEQSQLQWQIDVDKVQGRLLEARESVEEVREQLTVLKIRLAECRQQREGGKLARQRLVSNCSEQQLRLDQLVERCREGGERIVALKQKEESSRVELDLLITRRERGQEVIAATRERFEQERATLETLREELRQVRDEVESIRRDVSQKQLRQKELSVEIGHIRETVAEKFDVDLDEHQVAEADAEELERLQLQLRQLQQRIAALGEVNLTAIDEFKELEERYEFLVRQRDDLSQSLDDLQKAIGKINRTTRRRFKETFDLVNEKFKQVFPRLFRGGQAELRLTDENDLLETGIDIVVQPPGKKLQNVNLLSGGEKALTAVAIIFSLFLIKPTPFCMLDEVDAPLDDANIDRFAEMVAEMSANSQFIIITHSKRTMTTADIMHGITMQEPGVSKLVSVRVNDYQREEAVVAAS